MINIFLLNMKLFYANKWRILSFFSFIIIIGFVFFVTINHMTDQNALNPVQIAIVDLDNSFETQLIIQTIADTDEYVGLIDFLVLEKQQANQMIVENLVAAVITFPEDFGLAMTTGQNLPFVVEYNENRPIASSLIHIVATAFSDMLESSQIGVYTTLNYARWVNMNQEDFNRVFWGVNLQFLGIVMNRQNIFYTVELTTSQVPLVFNYIFAFYTVLLISSFFVIPEIISKAFTKQNLQNLVSKSTSKINIYLGTWLSLFTFILFLNGIIIFLLNIFSFLITLVISAILAFFGIGVTFIFKDNTARSLFLTLFIIISLFLSGGIIPIQFLPVANIFSYLTFNYWVVMFLAGSEAKIALAIFTVIFVAIGYFSLVRRSKG